MKYNQKYSIFKDFNTKDYRIYSDYIEDYLEPIFDSEEEAKEYLRDELGELPD